MSWEQLQAIQRENRDLAREAARTPLVACPIDGTLLVIRKDGVRNCPFGNFRWPR